MDGLKRLVAKIDGWQRHNRIAGPAYGVIRKFSDDQANLLVVSLGWYGFLAIYPLLLVVVTVLGFIGVSSLGHGLVTTLHQFPVIGSEFNPGKGGTNLHGSVPALVIGVVGLIYGAQGVTQNAEQAMSEVWNIPQFKRPGFGLRLARSLLALIIIGGAFVINAFVGSIAAGYGHGFGLRAAIIVTLLIINVGLYLAAFRVLTAQQVETTALIPGTILGGVGFTLLITVGAGLVQHQLRHSTATYGAFASVIGVVTFLLLLAKLSIYSAELNPVLGRRLWPEHSRRASRLTPTIKSSTTWPSAEPAARSAYRGRLRPPLAPRGGGRRRASRRRRPATRGQPRRHRPSERGREPTSS